MTFNYLLEFHLSDSVQLKYYIEGQIRFEIFATKFWILKNLFPDSEFTGGGLTIFAAGNLGKLFVVSQLLPVQ